MDTDQTLLFVSKDMGGANVSIPLARLAQRSGHSVIVIAEGLAAPKYEDAGFGLYSVGLDVKKVLEEMRPIAVVMTLGVPINLEEAFGIAANDLGIPLVFLEDYWGVHIRSRARPNLVLAIDEIAAECARSKFSPATRIMIVGNYAASNVPQLKISSEVKERVDDLRKKYSRVFVFTAGGPPTSEQILLLIECLKRTSDWVLVPRFHPKSANLMGLSGRTFGQEWQELLAPFGERVVSVESKTTEPLVALADVTLSGYSTLLTTALLSGRSAISLITPGVRAMMRNETGFRAHPLVGSGLVKEVTEPCDLGDYLDKPDSGAIAHYLRPYDPDRALQAIEALSIDEKTPPVK